MDDILQQNRSIFSNSRDLSLYFRQIHSKNIEQISCIEIYENFLYIGTSHFLAYQFQVREDPESSLELFNERSFPAQCKSAKLMIASDSFLVIIPAKEQQLIRIWSRESLQLVHGYSGHERQITSVLFLEDQSHLASCSEDGTVRIWKVSDRFEENKEVRRFTGVHAVLCLVEIDEDLLAFGGDDCVISMWNWRDDTITGKYFAHLGSVTSLSFLRPHFLLSTGGDSFVNFWTISRDGLFKTKKFNKKLSSSIQCVRTDEEQVLVVDSRGRAYMLNKGFELGSSNLRIEYTQVLSNVKLWRNRLFVIVSCNGNGQLREISVDLHQLRHNVRQEQLRAPSPSVSVQNQMSINIKWKDLTLSDPISGASILKGLSGNFESGQFVSIMGPSGAGKSSLLSLLTCRLRASNTKLQIGGQLLLNDEGYSLPDFSRLAAYVQQDDLLFGTLTVRETFEFQARLKLWGSSAEIQEQRCKEMLQKLNLNDCAETLVGNSQFKKSISGGQKKRVAIGVELLSNPQVLIFDEPTSGLDSHNALNITRLLGKLAREERKLVIATIHQPSTLIFREMDQLYLLCNGSRIFNGPAKQIVPYMESIGISLNYRMNPADFFMLQISQFKQRSGYTTPLNCSNFDRHEQQRAPANRQLVHCKTEVLQGCALNEEAPFWKQFWPLADRGFKHFYRSPSNQLNKLVTGILVPIFLGILYLNIGEAPSSFDQSYLFDFFCYLFMGQYIIFAMNIYDTCLVFPEEKEVVCKEAGGNLYSLVIYFFAKLATDVLGCVIPAITNGLIIYFIGGLDSSFNHVVIFMGILVLLSLTGFLFGLMFGVLNKNSEQAITLMPLAVIPLLIFGGLVIKINDIPIYVRWLQYLTPLRHSFIIIFQDQLSASNLIGFQNLNLPEIYGLNGDSILALGCLFALTGLYLVISLILLMLLKKKI